MKTVKACASTELTFWWDMNPTNILYVRAWYILWKKIKQVRGIEVLVHMCRSFAILYRMVKVTLEQRSERVREQAMWISG